MARYLVQATYNTDARKSFVAHPEDRLPGVVALTEKLGGKLDSFYYSMGEFDVTAIIDVPDDVSAVAAALAITGAGHLANYHTTKLLTNDEMLAAMNKAHGMTYAGPSGD